MPSAEEKMMTETLLANGDLILASADPEGAVMSSLCGALANDAIPGSAADSVKNDWGYSNPSKDIAGEEIYVVYKFVEPRVVGIVEVEQTSNLTRYNEGFV